MKSSVLALCILSASLSLSNFERTVTGVELEANYRTAALEFNREVRDAFAHASLQAQTLQQLQDAELAAARARGIIFEEKHFSVPRPVNFSERIELGQVSDHESIQARKGKGTDGTIYESRVKITFTIHRYSGYEYLEYPVRASATGEWTFPPAETVVRELQGRMEKRARLVRADTAELLRERL